MKIGNLEVYGVIYKITNIKNGKTYIGQTTRGFEKRYAKGLLPIEKVYNYHDNKRKNNYCYNERLYYSIQKYGFEAFEVSMCFDIAYSKNELDIKEEIYINYFDCIKNGYNIQNGGSHGKHSVSTKSKISKKTKERLANKENHPLFNKKVSEYTLKKKSIAMIEYYKTHDNPRKGVHLSDETKKKLSIAHSGKTLTEEHKEKIGVHSKGANNPAARDIYMYKDGELIKVFNTVNDCGMWLYNNGYYTSNARDLKTLKATLRTLISRNIKNNKLFCGFKLSYVEIKTA